MAFYHLIPVMGTIKAVADTSFAVHERSAASKARIEGVYGMIGPASSSRTLLLMLLYFVTRLKGQKNGRLRDLCRDFVALSDDLFANIEDGIQRIKQAGSYNPILKIALTVTDFALSRQRFADFKYDMLKMRYALEYASGKGMDTLPAPISEMADVIFNQWQPASLDFTKDWDKIFKRNF